MGHCYSIHHTNESDLKVPPTYHPSQPTINTTNQFKEDMQKFRVGLYMLAAAFSGLSGAANAQVPPGYPATYQNTIDAAKKEHTLIIYAATDTSLIRSLLK